MPNQAAAPDESTRRRNTFHAQRFARATSPRERAHAAYGRALAVIAKIQPDAARNAAYEQLERALDTVIQRVQPQDRR